MVWAALYLLVAVAAFAWLRNDRSADTPTSTVLMIALGWLPALALIVMMVVASLLIALWHRVGCR
ncbi:hypothetical protein [Sphingomonas sp. SAFR-052]|uniref:hypothetical protein n=1 Tax=Sphingomonas sp. SAFR-052 TaxID=3436867 RepID=UPI003F7F0F25